MVVVTMMAVNLHLKNNPKEELRFCQIPPAQFSSMQRSHPFLDNLFVVRSGMR
jgi:hypothetical protein